MSFTVGLVYDLKEDYLALGFSPEDVMEFDGEDTIAGFEQALAANGYRTARIGRGVEFAKRLVRGDRFNLVFNIAEGVKGRSREAQVPALCELFDQPHTFADPLTCALTLDKGMAKRVIRDHGLPTADFAVVCSLADLPSIHLPFPLFAKPIAEGSSKGVTGQSVIRSPEQLSSFCADMLARFAQPVLIETFLSGREVTVGIVGNGSAAKVVGVMEVIFNDTAETNAYTALNKDEYLERISYRLVDNEPLADQARSLALAIYHTLGCRDAGRVDLRCDSTGRLCFLEVNPLPGLNQVRSDLPIMARMSGISFQQLIGDIVTAARMRYGI